MDEGSYNIYGGRNASPMTPSTPGSNAFKTDIHRMKTRKWVEAKPQSYDGDDWGNDYDDDDEPEQPPSPPKPMARVFSQPVAASGSSGMASDVRSPSGPPTLHIQTQQPTPTPTGAGPDLVSDPSSLGSASERGHLDHIVSPQSAGVPQPAPSAHSYPGRPQYHSSTFPGYQSASNDDSGAAPRFTPPQSNVGPEDKAENADVAGAGLVSQAEPPSSARPAAERPSDSPRRSAATPTKPLPFVRPSDIYRRMEEEKEKERRSMESGRPSLDSVVQARSDRSSSPAKDIISPIDQRARANLEPDAAPDLSQFSKPVLAPVPEKLPEQTHHEEGDAQQPSASPRLPAVARMSGFGADMFSSSTEQLGLGNPPRISMQGSNASDNLPREPGRPSRPSIPGGWVSETTNIGSETATPMEMPEAKPTPLSTVQTSDVPPTDSDHEQDDIEPTTTIKQAPSLDRTPKPIAMIQAKHEACEDDFGAATGKHDEAVAHEIGLADVEPHPTPKNLPPLQTGDSDSTPTKATPASQTSQRSAEAPYQDSPSNYSAFTQQSSSTASHFTPTAPLNPHRGDVSSSESIEPGVLPRNLTMSTTSTGSPINENDRLQRDIIQSLSPMNSPSGSGLLAPAESNEPGVTRESRYLSGVYDDYMGSAEEKLRPPASETAHSEAVDQSHQLTDPTPVQTEAPQLGEPISEVASVSTEKTPTPEPQQNLRRRFSWEIEPDDVTLSPVAEARTEVSGSDLAKDEPQPIGPAQPVASDQPTSNLAPSLQLGPDSAATPSHQVSEASSRAPDLERARIDSPSPLSITSEQKTSPPGQSPAQIPGLDTEPAESEDHHLSLAEEKGLVQTSSQPVSPSPPQDDHPALSRLSAESPSPISPLPPSSPSHQQYHFITWQEIMSLPTSNQRVQRFEEAREQFQAMESGLSNWLRQTGSQPEHASLLGLPQGSMPVQSSATNIPVPSQRHTEASNPNIRVTSPGAGRTPSGNLLHGFQQSSFGAGTSRDRVGAKSKELLHSAGAFGNKATKSGMKLLSKGKNKLRGTGDKESALPKTPPPPTLPAKASATAPTRNERRSWSISTISALGARSASAIRRAAPHHLHLSRLSLSTPPRSAWGSMPATRDGNASTPILSNGPPQLPLPAHISPFNSVSHGGHSAPEQQPQDSLPLGSLPATTGTVNVSGTEALADGRYRPQPASTLISTSTQVFGISSPTSARQSSGAGNLHDEESNQTRGEANQLSVPAPISKHQPTLDPFTSPPLIEEEASDLGEPVSSQRSSPLPSASHDAVRLTTHGKSDGQVKLATEYHSAPDLIGSIISPSAKMTVPPNADQQAAPQQSASSSAPARQSSFVGLPPIRRMSTFHMKNPQKRWGGVIADADSPSVPQVDEQIPEVPPIPTEMLHQPGNGQWPEQHQNVQQPGRGFAQHAFQQSGSETFTNGRESFSPSMQRSSNGFLADRTAAHGPVSPIHFMGNGSGPALQQASMDRQRPFPGGPQPPFIAQAGPPPLQHPSTMPPGRTGRTTPPLRPNPASRFPQGQWKLEESHLAQPLHVARNRSSTTGPLVPPLPGYYAYDKEIEVESPAPQRLTRNGSVPPVSAQRFPDLFHPEGSSQSQGSSQHERFESESPRRGSPGPSRTSTQEIEERGKRHSGFFEEIGGKFLHRDRRDSISSLHRDDVSFSSAVLPGEHRQKKKRRSLLGLGGFLADDDAREEYQQPEGESSQQHAHKERSFSALRAFSKHKHDVAAAASETPNAPNEPQRSDQRDNPEDGAPPSRPKKRFSDLKGLLRGDSKDHQHSATHATAHSNIPPTQDVHSTHLHPDHRNAQLMQGPPQHGFQVLQDRLGQTTQPDMLTSRDQPRQLQTVAVSPQGEKETRGAQDPAPLPFRTHSPAMGPPSASQVSSVAESQPEQPEQRSRRASGGLLGGLFGNRSAKGQNEQPTSTFQLPRTQDEMHPDQVPRPAQATSQIQQPGDAGQWSGVQRDASGLSTRRLSQGMPIPQGPSQAAQPDNMRTPPTGLAGPGGMMGMRQPSTSSMTSSTEVSSSRPQRPAMPPQQRSQTDRSHPLGSHPVYAGSEPGKRSLSVSKESAQLSQHSSQERLSVSESSFAPRASPARKPVGSAPSKPRKKSVASLQPSLPASEVAETAAESGSKVTEPSATTGGPGQAERQLPSPVPSPVPSAQKTPRLGAPAPSDPVRQVSLPSPAQSPTPLTPSSGRPDGQQPSGQSLQPSASPKPPVSPHSPVPSGTMTPRRASRQSLGQVQEVQEQQLQQNAPPNLGIRGQGGGPQGPGPQQSSFMMANAQRPGPPVMNAAVSPGGPQYLMPQTQGPWQPQPPPSEERHKNKRLSKLFGGSKKDGIQHQTLSPQPSKREDEKEGGSKKLLNVFKRSSKQMNAAPSQTGSPGQRSPSSMSLGPGQIPGQQMPPHVWGQAGPGQIPSGPPTQGFSGPAPSQSYGLMQGGQPGQMRPTQMPGGQVQMPPNIVPMGRGGQAQTPLQQQWRASPQPGVMRYGPAPNAGRGFEGPGGIRPGMSMPYIQRPQQPGGFPPQSDLLRTSSPQMQSQYGRGQSPTQQQLGFPPHIAQAPQQAPQAQSTPQQLMAQRIMAQQPVTTQEPPSPSQLGAKLQGMALHASDILHRPQPQHIVTMNLQNQPHIQHPGSPQSYPLPDSAGTFSPVNPAAARLANPPLPPSESLGTRNMIDENLSRSVSNVSYPRPHPSAPPPLPIGAGHVSARDIQPSDPSRNSSLSPDAPVERTFSVSPERRTPSPGRQRSTSDTGIGKENIDAHPSSASTSTYGRETPRDQDRTSPPDPNLAPPHEYSSSHDVATTSATTAAAAQLPVRTSSSVYNSTADSSPGESSLEQQPTPSKEAEEKILVDQPAELSAVNDDDDNLIMSATSYPGQEWNPYAAGEFGYYED